MTNACRLFSRFCCPPISSTLLYRSLPSRPITSVLSSTKISTPVLESSLTLPSPCCYDTSLHPPSDRNVRTIPDRRRRRTYRNNKERAATVGATANAAANIRALTQSGGLPPAYPPPPPNLAYMAQLKKTEGIALLQTTRGDWPSHRPSGVPPRSSAGVLYAPPPRLLHPPVKSTHKLRRCLESPREVVKFFELLTEYH